MAEFKLSYTANEINKKLGKIDTLVSTINGNYPDANGNVNITTVSTVNGVAPDSNGNVEITINGASSDAIVDVLELPTENINDGVIYRLTTVKFVSNFYYAVDGWKCHYVDSLPEVGEPVTTDMINIVGYYNTQDNEVYGYVDNMVSASGGIPVGWYPIGVLGQAFNVEWGGVITDAEEIDDSAKLLLSKDYYIYQDGWCKIPLAYEKAPEFDIQWDGEIEDRIALDMSMLGYAQGVYFVKVSENVPTIDKVIGYKVQTEFNDNNTIDISIIDESDIDTSTFPGVFIVRNSVAIVHSQDELATALGIPTGIYTNGIYFWLETNYGHVSRLFSPAKITKIDAKYLPEINIDVNSLGLATVAKTGNYHDLYNTPTVYIDVVRYGSQSLSNSQKQTARNNISVYSKDEVDSKISSAGDVDLSNYATKSETEAMISEAIGSAIGGSY